jgi:cell division protein FtsX
MAKQKVQDEFKQCQDTTNIKLEKTQKQLNELREDFNNTTVKQRRL